ncbi:hypothetical protein C8R44DRAFT_710308, partial [Mycena epipterygia]
MYLWASRFDPTANGQDDFLALTVHHLGLEVAAIQTLQPPSQILQIIQASVLLSVYYLDSGRLVEGKYHCAAATSLAFSAGLHRVGSSSPAPHLPFLNSPLAVPPDGTRAKEMVDAFWSVVLLNNYWVAVSGAPSSILWDSSITTPWPTHEPVVLVHRLPVEFLNENDGNGNGDSTHTLLLKASILLARTITFAARDPSPYQPDFQALVHRLETFRDSLLSLDASAPIDQLLFIIHAFVNVALIRLYAPISYICEPARVKCFTAANWVISHLNNANLSGWDQVDPILGPLLSTVSNFYISQLSSVSTAAADLQTTFSAMNIL